MSATEIARPLPKPLEFLARAAFRVGPLEPAPGWYFGYWNRRDPRAIARRVIWRIARSRKYDGPVTTGWYFGLRFHHHLSGDISQCTYVDGRFEPNEMYAMSKLIGPGMTVVDVGANEGIFTIMAGKLVGPGGSVHAFEPSTRDRVRLLANIEENRLTNVVVHPEALGRVAGKAMLQVSGAERPGHNTLGGFAYPDDAAAYSIEVDVVSLDALALPRIDLVKIDVEGSETAVLQGATESLKRSRPVVVVEALDSTLRRQGSSTSELLQLLRSLKYEVKAFGPSGVPEPVIDDRLAGENLLCLPVSGPSDPPSRDPSRDR